jgi:hypothetical protein
LGDPEFLRRAHVATVLEQDHETVEFAQAYQRQIHRFDQFYELDATN